LKIGFPPSAIAGVLQIKGVSGDPYNSRYQFPRPAGRDSSAARSAETQPWHVPAAAGTCFAEPAARI